MSIQGRILVKETYDEIENAENAPAYLSISKFDDNISIHIESLDYMDLCVVSASKNELKEFALMLLKAVL